MNANKGYSLLLDDVLKDENFEEWSYNNSQLFLSILTQSRRKSGEVK